MGNRVQLSDYLDEYFHSRLSYFRGENHPPDHIMVIKLKELLNNLMKCDPLLATYFNLLYRQFRTALTECDGKEFQF